jgi:predicted RNase H-like HicB family nuclease
MTERRSLIVIEGAHREHFSAYAPDPPGVPSRRPTRDDVEREMRDAIALQREGLRDAGEPIPEPRQLTATYVEVAAWSPRAGGSRRPRRATVGTTASEEVSRWQLPRKHRP